MKAVLNKRFDRLVYVVDRLWLCRKELKAKRLNFRDLKLLSGISYDVRDSIEYAIEFHLWEGKIKNKQQFLNIILRYSVHDFYREFVKEIEE